MVADVAGIRRAACEGIVIVEDAAQSQGAVREGRHAGALGDIAATSFYPGKNLGAYGDGGGISTDSEVLAHAVQVLRNHGGIERYQHDVVGTNSRLDSLQAVVLSAKLRRLDEWNAQRRAIADRYRDLLAEDDAVRLPIPGERSAHVYHQFVVQLDRRDRVYEAMTSAGIGVGIHYPKPVHLLGAFAERGLGRPGSFPRAEAQAERILSLPVYPGLTPEAQDRVVAELRLALGRR
jgi:dTDP-4-amino-4,6-dideoxygalactose transaminase